VAGHGRGQRIGSQGTHGDADVLLGLVLFHAMMRDALM